ncbi:MAG: replication-associated recombination protein A [Saprospiraceae bacterium]|nr:replication-associated recombination protein A [Saprospiraceae bacterium]
MIPLAERMRPQRLDRYIGQEHIVGKDGVLRKAIEAAKIPSFILWGPPGVGKTTLAKVISNELKLPFYALSAINSGVKDVREAIDRAQKKRFFDASSAILFIDEIHRFSKSQQDSLLGAVEQGIVTLIGATTENPSFEVISALLSRCQVYILEPLSKDQLIRLVDEALATDEELKDRKINIRDYGKLLQYSGGDARRLFNALEIVIDAFPNEELEVTDQLVEDTIQQNLVRYDKSGDQHYDIISAFIKSIRGSDPNGALYWLARMIEGGEDEKFICRRMIISAAEDIGLANPNALLMATQAFQAVQVTGFPEARIIMSEAAVYLAMSAKSNSAYAGIGAALKAVKETGNLAVPLHLRNAPTKLMKSLGFGAEYDYAHDHSGNFSPQEYLPQGLEGTKFYSPQSNPQELKAREKLKYWWKTKYNY